MCNLKIKIFVIEYIYKKFMLKFRLVIRIFNKKRVENIDHYFYDLILINYSLIVTFKMVRQTYSFNLLKKPKLIWQRQKFLHSHFSTFHCSYFRNSLNSVKIMIRNNNSKFRMGNSIKKYNSKSSTRLRVD